MEKMYVHKDRYVFTVTGPEVDGNVPVRYVGLSPTVTGVSRRGRPPKATTLPVTQLAEVTDTQQLAQLAELVVKG